MIKVENLVKYFNSEAAVNQVSFEIAEAENLVLLGTSGCGKTTTLRMINRLLEPDSGRVWIQGVDTSLQDPSKLRRGIGYVLQHHGLFPHFTVAENIAVVPKLLNWKSEAIRKRTFELLEKLQLPAQLAGLYPQNLSGGQQQRVGLARSLMVNPPVLLMDEPFGALDALTRRDIRLEFRELEELKSKTILMVTHDVQEAFELGDRICLMDKGEIQQIGTAMELLFKPANDFVHSFFNDQRTQLEFKTVMLTDLFNSERVPANVSVWDVLENGPAGDREIPVLSDILTAFGNFKLQ